MTSNAKDRRLAYEAGIRANATSYSVHLFLGAGRFERGYAQGCGEVLAIGHAMTEAYPACQADPIYYAVDADGRSTTITPAQLKENAMIKVQEIATPATVSQDAKKAANAARMRASRAAKKAAPVQLPIAASHTEAEANFAEMTEASRMSPSASAKIDDVDLIASALNRGVSTEQFAAIVANVGADPAKIQTVLEGFPVLSAKAFAATLGTKPAAGRILPDLTERAQPTSGVCKSKSDAISNAYRLYGNAHTVKKTARGEWFWGPTEAATPVETAKASKPAKGGKKAAKATPAYRPVIKRGAALESAERGKIPSPPDFTAPTHTRFRAKLAEVVALVKARDIAGLEAVEIKTVSSSPKAIDKYRTLALIALKAKA